MALMNTRESCLIVVDVQPKLLAVMENAAQTLANIKLLAQAAEILKLPVIFSEQYPRGLGETTEELQPFVKRGRKVEKSCFSAASSERFLAELRRLERRQFVICGIEAHICVYQTAVELAAEGDVFVIADAVASRKAENKRLALDCLRCRAQSGEGARVASTEMALFEWLGDASHPQFKRLSKLAR